MLVILGCVILHIKWSFYLYQCITKVYTIKTGNTSTFSGIQQSKCTFNVKTEEASSCLNTLVFPMAHIRWSLLIRLTCYSLGMGHFAKSPQVLPCYFSSSRPLNVCLCSRSWQSVCTLTSTGCIRNSWWFGL